MAQHDKGPTKIGPYTLKGRLGTGGMSRVYRAVADGTTTEVALKLTPLENDVDVAVTDYHREVMVGRRVSHPRCVTATDHGCHDGFIYLVMPVVKGVPLSKTTRLRDPARRPSSRRSSAWKASWAVPLLDGQWIQLAMIGVQMAEALLACHAAGVIHRDIKPANIMMDRAGDTWLMDFGLAWMRRGPIGHELVTRAGTNRYLPPEVFDDFRDERGDIYSLGLTLHEIATGLKPWGDVTHEEIGETRPDLRVQPVREVRPDIPESLADCIDKACSEDPGERHQTPAELESHVRLVLDGLMPSSSSLNESCLNTQTWQPDTSTALLTEDVWFS